MMDDVDRKREFTFGEVLTELMRERGFKSDEQLARRAMQIQERLAPRVNVQRRTINNWRNDKSTPRSTDDQQFRLVAAALKLTDEDVARIERMIVGSPPLSEERGASKPEDIAGPMTSDAASASAANMATSLSINALSKTAFSPALLAVSVVAIVALAIFYYFAAAPSYLTEISPSQLQLSKGGFVLPDSDKRVVTQDELERLSGWELYVARNEIFARKGRPFTLETSICLQNHFDSWAANGDQPNGWYVKRSGAPVVSQLEYKNAEIIREYECRARGGQMKCDGSLHICR
ncbi:MAG: YARHG domain-containing protein [Pseudomonadota bacterium]